MTLILKFDPLKPELTIDRAGEIIKKGGLVAFPTDTVYGLGADAYNPKAVLKVFKVKNRPLNQPLPLLISSKDSLTEVSSKIPDEVYRVIDEAWPGPLTVIVKKSGKVPREVTGGGDKVGVRIPAHPVALNLISEVNSPLTGPSANIHGKPSPITAKHVEEDLYGKINAIIDGGEALLGLESTVVDFTTTPPTLIRPGMFEVEKLREIIGELNIPRIVAGETEKYSLKTPVLLVKGGDPGKVAEKIREAALIKLKEGLRVAVASTSECSHRYADLNISIFDLGSRGNTYMVAKRVFNFLREIDGESVDLAIVEGVEEKGIGLAVMNRLKKAAKKSITV